MSTAGLPQGVKAPLGGSEPRAAGERGGQDKFFCHANPPRIRTGNDQIGIAKVLLNPVAQQRQGGEVVQGLGEITLDLAGVQIH